MLSNLPTHVIAGPLGAGKTTLIRHLLKQRPEGERWAVLINEFGQIGVDSVLLHSDESGVQIAEVPGGCLCCVNGVPMRVGLTRLLRTAWPHRLFIEPSGLGHPAQLLEQLQQPPWAGVLAVEPLLLVLDAAALARGEVLPDAQLQALKHPCTVLMNKSTNLSEAQRMDLRARFASHSLIFTENGELSLSQLPSTVAPPEVSPIVLNTAPAAAPAPIPTVWPDVRMPICQTQSHVEGWSVGWRWHPSQRFDLTKMMPWLSGLGWLRAKAVIHGQEGWRSLNALAGDDRVRWNSSEWHKDSRLELIFRREQSVEALSAAVGACRINTDSSVH